MRQLIEVKRKHIKAGEPGNSYCCPVALAVQEQTGSCTVSVTLRRGISVGYVATKRTPRSVYNFASRFDSHKPVKPFRFYLDIP